MSTADEWQGMYRVAAARAEAAEAKVKELEAEARWIPVGERLPDEDENVLAFTLDSDVISVWFERGYFEDEDGRILQEECVTHWRQMPKPPEGK